MPGAKYDKPGVTVPSREYEAVLDFSQTYDCRFMPDAQQLIDKMRASSAVVVPAAAKAPEYDEHPVADIMDSSRDIINDLKD